MAYVLHAFQVSLDTEIPRWAWVDRRRNLPLSAAEQAQLSSIARSRSMPAALAQRARIVLACASGQANNAVARRFEISDATVGKWRRRFLK